MWAHSAPARTDLIKRDQEDVRPLYARIRAQCAPECEGANLSSPGADVAAARAVAVQMAPGSGEKVVQSAHQLAGLFCRLLPPPVRHGVGGRHRVGPVDYVRRKQRRASPAKVGAAHTAAAGRGRVCSDRCKAPAPLGPSPGAVCVRSRRMRASADAGSRGARHGFARASERSPSADAVRSAGSEARRESAALITHAR